MSNLTIPLQLTETPTQASQILKHHAQALLQHMSPQLSSETELTEWASVLSEIAENKSCTQLTLQAIQLVNTKGENTKTLLILSVDFS